MLTNSIPKLLQEAGEVKQALVAIGAVCGQGDSSVQQKQVVSAA
jgi:hypothetical protein